MAGLQGKLRVGFTLSKHILQPPPEGARSAPSLTVTWPGSGGSRVKGKKGNLPALGSAIVLGKVLPAEPLNGLLEGQ